METPSKKTVATAIVTAVAGAVIALVPALLGFIQNRAEIRAKYDLSQANAAAGYAALVTAVKELQVVVQMQHDDVLKLQTRVEADERYAAQLAVEPVRVGTAHVVRPHPPEPAHTPTVRPDAGVGIAMGSAAGAGSADLDDAVTSEPARSDGASYQLKPPPNSYGDAVQRDK
jgi:hypothetical protein